MNRAGAICYTFSFFFWQDIQNTPVYRQILMGLLTMKKGNGYNKDSMQCKSCNRQSKMGDISMQQLHSCYVVGESRTNADNAITKIYNSFYMSFEVDDATGHVVNFACTHTLALTEDFLRRMFVGQDFIGIGVWLEEALAKRYGGSSRRAVVVSYRDAVKRYRAMRALEESCML